jgi:hypothetical protein
MQMNYIGQRQLPLHNLKTPFYLPDGTKGTRQHHGKSHFNCCIRELEKLKGDKGGPPTAQSSAAAIANTVRQLDQSAFWPLATGTCERKAVGSIIAFSCSKPTGFF